MVETNGHGALCLTEPEAPPPVSASRFRLHAGGRGDARDGSSDDREAAIGLRALLSALEARHAPTRNHSDAVARLVWETAQCMGLSAAEAVDAAHVALVHDIGKVAIPDAILLKQGSLTADEWRVMQRHPEIGEGIVASIPALRHLAPAVRAEHERWDGCGYPDGLSGEAIPLASRLVLVGDAYEAMISDRPYRDGMTPDEALGELQAHAGSQFDPKVVAALVAAQVGEPDVDAVAITVIRSTREPAPPAHSRASMLSAPGEHSSAVVRPFGHHDVADSRLASAGVDGLDVLYLRH